MHYTTSNPGETFELARRLGEQAQPGLIFAINGDLGTGKTVFCQGIAAGLGVTEPVNSPTFTIIQEYYSGRLPLYHFDVYRLGDVSEFQELGYEEYFFGSGICLVEWADNVSECIPEYAVNVNIRKDMERGDDFRIIDITGISSIR